ncbi:MAG TPA: cytochrome c3 family protein [Thermoanaerobaculia bacterium]|nr:cytochrome c3 family protein [Thermoanaerobaculia bacterium]
MRTHPGFLKLFLAALVIVAAPARAGEYHYAETLLCSDCHAMHFSMQHDWDGTTPVSATAQPNGDWLGATGPNQYLLKAQESQLCLSCHDGQTWAPDVYGANTGTAYVRQAGAIPTGTAPYEQWKGHTLNVQATPPGGTSNIRLQCVSCHSSHGNVNYRNLDGATPIISYARGTNNTTKDVFLRSFTLGAITTNYATQNVDFNEPGPNASAMGRFCRGCHTDFHGGQYDSNMFDGVIGVGGWIRHPTAGANIGALGGGHSSTATLAAHAYRVQVMSPTGTWGPQGATWGAPPGDLSPSCMSCHKAHGNQNPFGLIFLKGTGPELTEEGDAAGNTGPMGQRLSALCGQCHVQAS